MSNGNIPTPPAGKQLAEQQQKRQYQRIWESIKEKEPGKVTEVAIHTSAVSRLIQAVKKEKNRDVGIKKQLGLLRPGPLQISQRKEIDRATGKETGRMIVSFLLPFDGSKL